MMKKPYIHLFKTPNNYYFFDVNKSEFTPISEDSFSFLSDLTRSSEDTCFEKPIPAELSVLKEEGYLAADSVVEKISHPYSKDMHLLLSRKLSGLTLQLTQDCNLRCRYCTYTRNDGTRQRQHTNEAMDWETAKKAIDFLWERSVDSESISIGFYGGEPLLEFTLLKEVVYYSLERFSGKKVIFNMTTNGTLLNDEMIMFLEEHDASMMISLDGPKEINDQNRVFECGTGTFDAVVRNIKRVTEIAPKLTEKLQIGIVINPENDFDIINSVFSSGSELNGITVTPTLVEYDYEDVDFSYCEEYSAKMEYQFFLAILAQYGRFSAEKVSPIADVFLSMTINDCNTIEKAPELFVEDTPSGACIPGIMRLFVDIHGNLFPCERVSETSPVMKMGTLDKGFCLEKTDKILNSGAITMDSCLKCWCFRFCNLCVKRADDGKKLCAKTRLSYCKETQAFVHLTSTYYLLFKEIPIHYAVQTRIKQKGDNIIL